MFGNLGSVPDLSPKCVCVHLSIIGRTLDLCQRCLSRQQLSFSFSLFPSISACMSAHLQLCAHILYWALRNHSLEAQLSYDYKQSDEHQEWSVLTDPLLRSSVFVPAVLSASVLSEDVVYGSLVVFLEIGGQCLYAFRRHSERLVLSRRCSL